VLNPGGEGKKKTGYELLPGGEGKKRPIGRQSPAKKNEEGTNKKKKSPRKIERQSDGFPASSYTPYSKKELRNLDPAEQGPKTRL